jgi:hypothetical protein
LGFQGRQGIQGAQGDRGIQGTQGFQGNQGRQGTQGFQGFQGNQGLFGTQGVTGTQGTIGSKGIQGDPGPKGATGDKGSQGVPGDKGEAGSGGAASNLNTQAISGTIGYIVFPPDSVTGISTILQYGTVARGAADWTEPNVISVGLPVTFPNACLSVQLTVRGLTNNYDVWAQVRTIGTSFFDFLNQRSSSGATQTDTLYFTALGY